MKVKTLALAVGLAVTALGSIGAANAVPVMLQIVGGNAESIGDPGGTAYPSAPSPVSTTPGPGMPTDLGGWPNNYPVPGTYPPGFGQDASYFNNWGISGFDQSYLKLTGLGAGTTNVTFQYMGKGDSSDHNLFQLYWNLDGTGVKWNTIFDTWDTHGTCGASGSPPSIDCSPAGSSRLFTFVAGDLLPGGYIPFRFMNLTTPGTATNDGTHNGGHDVGGYFLGMDPYLASGAYDTSGTAAYAGFTDRGCVPGEPCDHDYEDLIVRVSVPEPGSLFLLGAGLLGLAGLRRRKA